MTVALLIAVPTLAFAIAVMSSWIFLGRAARWGFVAPPNPDVRTHTMPIPLLGGASILIGLVPFLIWTAAQSPAWTGVLAGLAVVTGLGLYKDRYQDPLSPMLQLIVQGAAATLVVRSTGEWSLFDSVFVDTTLSVVFCVVTINAINFLDVMDGLAGSVCAMISMLFTVVAFVAGDVLLGVVALALAGSIVGFLLYNRPPARIFMGDVGSFGLGLLLSAMLLSLDRDGAQPFWYFCFFLVPLADMLYTTLSRVVSARSPLRGGGEHLSLRFLNSGHGNVRVLSWACLLTFLSGLVAFLLQTLG